MALHIVTQRRFDAGRNWRRSVLAFAAGLAFLSGCVSTSASSSPTVPASAEELEFRNMRPSNRVPKSSGAALVSAFERFCLDAGREPALIANTLRNADYVAAPRQPGDSATSFLVDDRRPLVHVADDGRFCAVFAEARTGQSARIQRLIAQRFPNAPGVAGEHNADEFTIRVSTNGDALIALRRQFATFAGPQLALAIQYDA